MPDFDRVPPRPQLGREGWIDLCGEWEFAYDDAYRGLRDAWHLRADVYDHTIYVPFPPESPASGIGDTGYHPVVWYRRRFHAPLIEAGRRVILHFGAVDYRSRVWVNGQLVTTHQGGNTPFEVDITGALQAGTEQVLVVCAEDYPEDLEQPRGKQDWLPRPHTIFYERTTGIWQPVWLEVVAATHIESLRWTPDVDRRLVRLDVRLRRVDFGPVHVHVTLRLHGQLLADNVYSVASDQLRTEIGLDALASRGAFDAPDFLWSPDHPNLIDAQIEVLDTGTVIDAVSSYFGMRAVSTERGFFMLNGKPFYLRLVLEQGYWPESHLAAPSVDAMEHEVRLAKSLGFNGLRIHQKVEDPRFLYWCDRLGLVVWGEMANAYSFSERAVQALVQEWQAVLDRDYSHPCIVAWVPVNESWGVPHLTRDERQRHYVESLYHLTKTLDPTRPVVANDGWEYFVGDVVGVHDYGFYGTDLEQRYGSTAALERTFCEARPSFKQVTLPGTSRSGQPIILSEFGGLSLRPYLGEEWFGYGTVATSDELLEKYAELVKAVLHCPPIAGFCYTQLTDTGQETNGLLTAAREPKLAPHLVYAITSRASMALPAEMISQMQRQIGAQTVEIAAG